MGIVLTKFRINKTYPEDSDRRLSEFLFFLYTTLKEAGWRPVADSDGTTRSGTGSQLTHAGTGANGMKNANAWWILRQPSGGSLPYAGNRTITIRRNTNADYSMWYSYSGNLTTIGNATTPDTAADTRLVGTTTVSSHDICSRIAMAACDAAENFGWWCFSWRGNREDAAGTGGTMFFFDPCRQADPDDLDPYVIMTRFSVVDWTPRHSPWTSHYNTSSRCWFRYGTSEALFERVCGTSYRFRFTDAAYPNHGGLSQYDKKILTQPIIYQRPGFTMLPISPTYKGISTLFRWSGRNINHGSLFSVNGTVRYMGLYDILARWETMPGVYIVA